MAILSVARTITRSFFLALCVWTFSTPCMGPQIPGGQAPMMANDDPFSPENIAQVAEELSKLTPEQQEQLYKESLDFLSKELNISPEEIEKMVADEFNQTVMPQPEAKSTEPAAEILKSEPTVTKQRVEEKEAPVKDLNDVATLLKNFADITDTIMRKASGLPDLPSRVDRWIEQKKLSSWQSGLSWASFKKQLELLVQKLGKLQNKDPKTNTYLYLPELLHNVSLKNNIERLYRTLKQFNAEFITNSFDIDAALDDPLAISGSLSTEAKDALLGILNTYGNAFYSQNLFKDFDALIQKFDPTAQKLRTEEETSAKKALEASKQTRPTSYIKESRKGGHDSYYGGSSGSDYYPSSYYPGSSYGSGNNYPYSYGSDSSKTAETKDNAAPESKKTTSTEKDTEASSEKVKWMREISNEVASAIRNLGNDIRNNFSTDKLNNLFKEETPLDTSLSSKINDYVTTYQRIETDIKTLVSSSKSLSLNTQRDLFAPIRESYGIHKEALLESAKKINTLDLTKLSKDQRSAYFGKEIKTTQELLDGAPERKTIKALPETPKLTREAFLRLKKLLRTDLEGFEDLNKKEIYASITPEEALDLLNKVEAANKTPKKVAVSKEARSFEETIKARAALFEESRAENRKVSQEIEDLRFMIKSALPKQKLETVQPGTPELKEKLNAQKFSTTNLKTLASMLSNLNSLINGLPQAETKAKR